MGVAVIAVMLLTRGLKREIPSEATASGLGYPEKVKEAVQESDTALSDLSARLDRLEIALQRQEEGSRVLIRVVEDVLGDLQAVKNRLDRPDGT